MIAAWAVARRQLALLDLCGRAVGRLANRLQSMQQLQTTLNSNDPTTLQHDGPINHLGDALVALAAARRLEFEDGRPAGLLRQPEDLLQDEVIRAIV